MEISLNRDSTTPLYQQLRNQIRDQIISGELTDGFKLPSERQLVVHSIMSPVYYQNRMLGAKDFATHDKCILPDLKKNANVI